MCVSVVKKNQQKNVKAKRSLNYILSQIFMALVHSWQVEQKPGGRGRAWATLGLHPLSWLLSNNRLEKVPFVSVPHASSNRLLLSNQDKGCTPTVGHSLALPLGPALLNLWNDTWVRCHMSPPQMSCQMSSRGHLRSLIWHGQYMQKCCVSYGIWTQGYWGRGASIIIVLDVYLQVIVTCGCPA